MTKRRQVISTCLVVLAACSQWYEVGVRIAQIRHFVWKFSDPSYWAATASLSMGVVVFFVASGLAIWLGFRARRAAQPVHPMISCLTGVATIMLIVGAVTWGALLASPLVHIRMS